MGTYKLSNSIIMKFWNTAGATVPSGASPDFHTKAVDMDGSTEYMSNTTNVAM